MTIFIKAQIVEPTLNGEVVEKLITPITLTEEKVVCSVANITLNNGVIALEIPQNYGEKQTITIGIINDDVTTNFEFITFGFDIGTLVEPIMLTIIKNAEKEIAGTYKQIVCVLDTVDPLSDQIFFDTTYSFWSADTESEYAPRLDAIPIQSSSFVYNVGNGTIVATITVEEQYSPTRIYFQSGLTGDSKTVVMFGDLDIVHAVIALYTNDLNVNAGGYANSGTTELTWTESTIEVTSDNILYMYNPDFLSFELLRQPFTDLVHIIRTDSGSLVPEYSLVSYVTTILDTTSLFNLKSDLVGFIRGVVDTTNLTYTLEKTIQPAIWLPDLTITTPEFIANGSTGIVKITINFSNVTKFNINEDYINPLTNLLLVNRVTDIDEVDIFSESIEIENPANLVTQEYTFSNEDNGDFTALSELLFVAGENTTSLKTVIETLRNEYFVEINQLESGMLQFVNKSIVDTAEIIINVSNPTNASDYRCHANQSFEFVFHRSFEIAPGATTSISLQDNIYQIKIKRIIAFVPGTIATGILTLEDGRLFSISSTEPTSETFSLTVVDSVNAQLIKTFLDDVDNIIYHQIIFKSKQFLKYIQITNSYLDGEATLTVAGDGSYSTPYIFTFQSKTVQDFIILLSKGNLPTPTNTDCLLFNSLVTVEVSANIPALQIMPDITPTALFGEIAPITVQDFINEAQTAKGIILTTAAPLTEPLAADTYTVTAGSANIDIYAEKEIILPVLINTQKKFLTNFLAGLDAYVTIRPNNVQLGYFNNASVMSGALRLLDVLVNFSLTNSAEYAFSVESREQVLGTMHGLVQLINRVK